MSTKPKTVIDIFSAIEYTIGEVQEPVAAIELKAHRMVQSGEFSEDDIPRLGTAIKCRSQQIRRGIEGVDELAREARFYRRRAPGLAAVASEGAAGTPG